MQGISISDKEIIGDGSVVNKDVPANTIVAGVLARPMRILNGKSENIMK